MKADLERQLAGVNDEIRNYPTPIARCDVQLTELLERRARLMAELERAAAPAGGCTPINTWINDGGPHGA